MSVAKVANTWSIFRKFQFDYQKINASYPSLQKFYIRAVLSLSHLDLQAIFSIPFQWSYKIQKRIFPLQLAQTMITNVKPSNAIADMNMANVKIAHCVFTNSTFHIEAMTETKCQFAAIAEPTARNERIGTNDLTQFCWAAGVHHSVKWFRLGMLTCE